MNDNDPRDPTDASRSGTPDRDSNDVGRTSGGGSLGHNQPEKVERDTPLRNNVPDPEDDPTLTTKI